jgi:hypothetical protein
MRCIVDFTYCTRMLQIDEDNLAELQSDLAEFHQHKDAFVTKGVYVSKYGFAGIAKLHVIPHYAHLTREMETPDDYSTKGPERLHIDYVKEPYQQTSSAGLELQMTHRLEQQEAWDFL